MSKYARIDPALRGELKHRIAIVEKPCPNTSIHRLSEAEDMILSSDE
jgi:hypothetical protein